MHTYNIFWQSEHDVLEGLRSSREGLSQHEADERRATYGSNLFERSQPTALRILGRQVKSSLVYLLFIADLFCFLLRDISDGIIIAILLVINATLGFLQEYRSEKAVAKLSTYLRRQVLVKRDAQFVWVAEALLVPGDIIHLQEGDIVPADCKLLSAENLQVNESQLTGEAVPVTKTVQPSPGNDRDKEGKHSLLFAGSVLEKGEALAVVYAIGPATELGTIASLSTRTQKVTRYERSLQAFSALLIRVVLITLALTLCVKLLMTAPSLHPILLLQLVLFLVALAIAVVPEALPVITTVTLSAGAIRLAKQDVVVKRLSSAEDLGNITLLCTDKTGTLTENRMTIQKLVADDLVVFQTFAAASLETAPLPGKKGLRSFDAAFQAFLPQEIQEQARMFHQVQVLPFDPEARRRRVVLEEHQPGKPVRHYLVVIGSAETLLEIAACPQKRQYLERIAQEGAQGLRHLALACREVAYTQPFSILDQEHDLSFLGYVTLFDPLRPGTKETIETAKRLGVAIKILTGDSKEVAAYVADQIGLGNAIMTGKELEGLSPAELQQAVTTSNVFARVTPAQKYTLIEALKHDQVVGYQGDGINDAPALKLADVAIAVDSATDVAKESADIVLLKKDLGVIVNGIRSGRAIFLNITKYMKYTMVGNFGNFFALTFLYLLAQTLPLLPLQVLLTSLLTDVPLITIASDTVNPEEMLRPEKYDAHALMFLSLLLGSLTALFEVLFFALVRTRSPLFVQTNMFLYLTCIQLIAIVAVRNREHFWRGKRPSWQLAVALALALVVSVVLLYVPGFETLFHFTPLPLYVLLLILVMLVLYVLLLDFVKVWYYRMVEKGSASPA